MSLDNGLISQFVKITNDNKQTKNESTVYGTIVEYDGSKYVKFDGSELLTPYSSTTNVKEGERVTVTVKNHMAIVTGNLSSPSARTEDVDEVRQEASDELGKVITSVETLLADKVDTKEFNAAVGRIDTLVSENVTIKKTLTANSADIRELEAGNATINDTLTAMNADITNLKATDVTIAGKLDAADANIGSLQADNVLIRESLTAAEANITELVADNVTINNTLTAQNADIEELETKKLSAADADLKYANIDFSNIGAAAIEKFFAKSGMIEDVVVGDGTITGTLVGVTITGDLIKGNTIVADKLVIKGDDGLYYKLNTDGVTTESEQTEYNSLNGSVITAKSITATKISVNDLVAFDATIGGFNITDSALYSGVKDSIDNTTQGIYLGSDGQMVIGDSNNYIKFYRDKSSIERLFAWDGYVDENDEILAFDESTYYVRISDELLADVDTSMPLFTVAVSEGVDAESYLNVGEYTYIPYPMSENDPVSILAVGDLIVLMSFYEAVPAMGISAPGTYILYRDENNWCRQIAYYKEGAYGDSHLIISADTLVFGGSGTNAIEAIEDAKETADNAIQAIDKLEVGGRNVLRHTDVETYSEEWSAWSGGSIELADDGYLKITPGANTTSSGAYPPKISSIEDKTEYTLSFEAYSDSDVTLNYCYIMDNYGNQKLGASVPITTTPERYSFAFTTDAAYDESSVMVGYTYSSGAAIPFYIRNVKLEKGNKATDWTPAPEDIDESISDVKNTAEANATRINDAQLSIDSMNATISSLVTGENGESLMTQTDTGWTFNIASIQNALSSANNDINALEQETSTNTSAIDNLKQSVDDLGEYTDYIKFGTEDGQPCIILGETDSAFKVVITNTEIRFMEGSTTPAYISNQSLHISKAVVQDELSQGGFVWTARSNGNYGILWKG